MQEGRAVFTEGAARTNLKGRKREEAFQDLGKSNGFRVLGVLTGQ